MFFPHHPIGGLCLVSLLFLSVWAAPIDTANGREVLGGGNSFSAHYGNLTKRAPGDSMLEPIDAYFDTRDWEDIAEQDCYVMLCVLGGRRVFKKEMTEAASRRNYIASGASARPFFSNELSQFGTQQINLGTTSAEEFPWRSIDMDDDGPDALRRYLSPAEFRQQNFQGGLVNGGYTTSSVGPGQWFRIHLSGNLGPYCTALMGPPPPDRKLCGKENKVKLYDTDVNPGDYIYFKTSEKGKPITFGQWHFKST